MSDRSEIERLIFGYAECIDSGNFEGVAQVFANGRLIAPDGSVLAEGYDEMLAFNRATLRIYPDTNTPLTQHIMSNLVINIDDDKDTATSTCYYTVLQKTDDAPLQPIIAGRYRGRFERSRGAWELRERQALPFLYGDLSRHLLQFTQE